MKKIQKKLIKRLSIGNLFALSILAGCNSASTGTDAVVDTAALTVSGTVSIPSRYLRKLNHLHDREITPADVDLSNFSLTCVTLEASPTYGTGSVAANGSFSFSIPSAIGAKISCSLTRETPAKAGEEEVIASMVVVDDSEQDFDGNSQSTTSVALTDDTDFGTVELNLEEGTLEVDQAEIADTIDDAPISEDKFWDSTGTWTISSIGTLPPGFEDVCPAGPDARPPGEPECHGPREGEEVYFRQINGKKWVGDLATGSATEEDRYGIMVWQSQTAFETCSNQSEAGHYKLGTSFDDLKEKGFDFSAPESGIEEGAYEFETSIDGVDTLTDGYKSSAAVANWDMRDCHGIPFMGLNAWICRDGKETVDLGDDTFQMSLNGGCKDDSNNPIRIDDWKNIEWADPMNPCTNETTTEGFIRNTCAGSYTPPGPTTTRPAIQVTCVNEYARTASPMPTSTGDINNELMFNWNNVATFVEKDGLCSAINTGDAQRTALEQARCYAEYYERNTRDSESDETKCFKRIRANWTANTAEDFIRTSDEPQTRHAASFYHLDATGVGTLHTEESDFKGVQVENSWINCHVRRAMTINMAPKTKSGDVVTEAIGTMEQEEVLVDNNKEACVAFMQENGATKKDLGNGIELWVMRSKSIFKFTRDL